MDIEADLEELSALHKELENHPDAGGNAEEMKKAPVSPKQERLQPSSPRQEEVKKSPRTLRREQ